MEKELIASAFYFYTRIEKRGLPLETSKALINFYYGKTSRDTSNSMLERAKSYLSFWIENDSLVQIYKRYFNSLLKKEDLTLGECFAPFVLINCQESFDRLIFNRRRKQASVFLENFFGNLDIEDLFSLEDREEFFKKLYRRVPLPTPHRLYISTHIAFLVSPNDFPPLTPSTGSYVDIRSLESYLRFRRYIRERKHRPIEVYALLHTLLESVPSKRKGIENVLGLDREHELLLKASELWNKGRFYEVHEVLEEVWKGLSDRGDRECLQGIIRLAIALHHVTEGERKRAINVLRKALPQMKGCGRGNKLNVSELRKFGEALLHSLQNASEPPTTPKLRVI